MNNRDLHRFNRVMSDPGFRQFCVAWANEAGVPLPHGTNPAFYVMSELFKADPETCTGVFNNCLAEFEKHHGAPPAGPHDAHDWDAELPAAEVVKAWKALPEHSRLRQSATSPQTEQMARRDLARMGGHPLPGLSAGETVTAYLNYAGKHSRALASGDRAVYDSLAARLGGALGDGESLRWMVDGVRKIHRDDHVLNRLAQKTAAAEAEAAKHRPKPLPQPTFDKKFTPQSAIRPKEKPRDGTRDEVARQHARQKAGWELPENRRPQPLNMTIQNRDQFHAAMALVKVKGESPARVFARLSPALHKELIGELRDKGMEPALASRSSGNSSERHWVPARSNTSSSESYSNGNTSSSGDYASGDSSESTGSEGAAQTGSGT